MITKWWKYQLNINSVAHIYHHLIIVYCCSLCTSRICIWQTPPLFQYRLTAVLASHLHEWSQLYTAHLSADLNIDGTDTKPHQPPSKFATGCGMSNISYPKPYVLTSGKISFPLKKITFLKCPSHHPSETIGRILMGLRRCKIPEIVETTDGS